jgi:cystathionine gamma-lyase
MAQSWRDYSIETRFIHSGQPPDPVTGAVNVPISLATTYAQPTPGQTLAGYDYSRAGNPTRTAFENCVAECEGAKYGLAYSSGCGATATILAMYGPGDHIVSSDDVYGGSRRLFDRVATPSQSLSFTYVDSTNLADVEKALQPNTKMFWLETPTNPNLKVSDVEKIAELCHARGVKLFVDATFCSPYCMNPILLGADLSYHSVTKYIGGHSDVIMGVISTNDEELYEKLKFLQKSIGAVPSPFECYLAIRGLKTLHLRMKACSENALRIAEMLESHSKIERVMYPGLASHPQHEVSRKQMRYFSGMITFWLKGGLEQSRIFLESVKLFTCAESLGAVESLIEHPAIMTHASVPPEQRRQLGISDTMVRISVGCENIDDLMHDMTQALEKVPETSE